MTQFSLFDDQVIIPGLKYIAEYVNRHCEQP